MFHRNVSAFFNHIIKFKHKTNHVHKTEVKGQNLQTLSLNSKITD